MTIPSRDGVVTNAAPAAGGHGETPLQAAVIRVVGAEWVTIPSRDGVVTDAAPAAGGH